MKRMALLTTTLTLAVLVVAPLATADVPHMINYQGRLTDSADNPIDTVVEMTFSICLDSAGLVCVWGETQDSIAVVNGLFNVKLGADSALTDEVFGSDNLWMHVKVGSVGGQVIEPPTQLITVPYAYRVSTVDGASGGVIAGEVAVQNNLTVSGDLEVTGDIIGSTPWTAFPFAAGYNDYEDGHPGSGLPRAQYRKIGDVVYLRGIIHKADHGAIPGDSLLGTLPPGFRPPATMFFYVDLWGTIKVMSSGDVVSPSGDPNDNMWVNIINFSTSP